MAQTHPPLQICGNPISNIMCNSTDKPTDKQTLAKVLIPKKKILQISNCN